LRSDEEQSRHPLTKIFAQGFRTPDWRHNEPPPVVSLEDFFEGNTDPMSITVNLSDHPGLEYFYDHLRKIRSREDVADVLVNIYDLDNIIHGEDHGWPVAENVHILTQASEAIVQGWADELRSNDAIEGWPYGRAKEIEEPPLGFRWWALSWD
jgi:hypothetical protein